VIGRLVTDEQFRRRFEANAVQALQEVALAGVELTDVEMRALSGLDARTVSRFADAIDPRLQKICCRAEETSDESRTH
jgi:hypothetical protein